MVTGRRTAAVVRGLPSEVEWRTGLFGAIASVAALDAASDEWLDALRARLDLNRRLLADLLAAHLRALAIACRTRAISPGSI
jgi:cystathionine beta-lyase